MEYLDVKLGAFTYQVVRTPSRFYVVYVEPMKKGRVFAKTETLTLAFQMIKSHLRGKHQCIFTLTELMKSSSGIHKGNFEGFNIA